MQITLDLPDCLTDHLVATGQDPSRAILELLAAEGYRMERLTEHEVRILLGFESRVEVHTFLAEKGIPLHYTLEHLQQDIRASDLLHSLRTDQTGHTE